MLSCAEGNANHALRSVRKIQSTSQSYVAVQCSFILPIEAIVVSEVGPAIVYSDISTRCFGERNGGPYREPRISLVCEKQVVIPNV